MDFNVELVNRYHKAKKELIEATKDEIKISVNNFLKNNPDVIGFKWRQYTPYFNDGDACHFGIEDSYVLFKGNENYKSEYDDDDDLNKKQIEIIQNIDNFLRRQIPSELLLDTFGDHKEVIIDKDGEIECVDFDEHN
jgi:hypothetical protein